MIGGSTRSRIVLDLLRSDAGTTTWQGVPTAELPCRIWGYLRE